MRILVTGAGGRLGAVASAGFAAAGHDVIPMTRAALDVRDHRAVDAVVAAGAPDLIVNGVAYNDVDGAEDDPRLALEVNALAVRALAAAASARGAAFVHYSTDFVFDGLGSRPYREDDEPRPQGVYATSKLLGEWFAREVPRHYVLRVESLFGWSGLGPPPRRGSIDAIGEALRSGREARVFTDRTVSPSYVHDVARATRFLVEHDAPAGLYHCVNTGACTWHELGQALLEYAPAGHLVPVAVADVPLRARRPAYAALSNAKLAAAGFVLPSWRDALRRYVEAGWR